jgi:hypothetical protein
LIAVAAWQIAEFLSYNAHEIWAQARLKDGWK